MLRWVSRPKKHVRSSEVTFMNGLLIYPQIAIEKTSNYHDYIDCNKIVIRRLFANILITKLLKF